MTLHGRLAPVAESLLENVLRERGVDHLSVTSRTKDFSSALEKIVRKRYSDPQTQMTDLTGIRIIVFFDAQVKQSIDIIRSILTVDEANSLDQSQRLGSDRIGYRSTHFVCSLGAERAHLVEYGSIADLKFEIQVRTVLQHAWAELAHDRSYKFGPGLPHDIQRELNLYSGLLEIADRAFDKIASGIEDYQNELRSKTSDQINQLPVNALSLKQYIDRAANQYKLKLTDDKEITERVLSELEEFGITNVGQVDQMLTEEFCTAYRKAKLRDNYGGLLRSMMMYNNLSKYFVHEASWGNLDKETFALLSDKYRPEEIRKILNAANMEFTEK
ncbi:MULTISPECIES: hypothetical protein [Methylobacterium]|uniref:GTP pyrophosphokinase n=1 Tax=Methylobacterium TaxID=407 RepID=UPI002F350307